MDNQDGQIREGDYFTIELDKKLRPNGITDQSIVSAVLPTIVDYSKKSGH
ncbi:Ig-like domain-containing protein [Mobilibacterium timonense]